MSALRRFAVLVIAVAAAAAWNWCSPPSADDLVGGDEGYYGTMARNVLSGPAQALSPSLSPLGLPGDKPPLVPLLIAPFVRALGAVPAAVRMPFRLCALGITIGIGVLVTPVCGVGAGAFATALLATLPWYADASRSAAAEIPLTLCVVLALVLIRKNPRSLARGVLAGALLGLAFLCKLWLVAPGALAAAALVVAPGPPSAGYPSSEWVWGRRSGAVLAAMTGAALLVASAHLVAVACFQPQWFPHWRYIYMGRSLAERVFGEGYADYWRRPVGAYWATATRAFGLVLPLVAAGAESAWRRRAEPVPRALLVWACGLLLLSVFRVKAGGYAYVVVPAWAGLAALGAQGIAKREAPHVGTLVVAALLTSPLLGRWQAAGLPITLWAAVWLGGGLLVWLSRRLPARAPRLVAVWAVLAVAFGALRTGQRLAERYHAPGYADVAALVAPLVAGVAPGRPCFVAPEAPVFAFHLFRTGSYWGTPITPWSPGQFANLRADTGLRVFVVDTTRTFYGGWPDAATLEWLERETREITSQLPPRAAPGSGAGARARPLRVFRR